MGKFDKGEFIKHAARAFFASAWADQCEESENAGMMAGAEIMDIMPDELDPAALHAARTLAAGMERENNAALPVIFAWAAYAQARARQTGDRPLTVEMFGHYCAMQAMGHGVGLHDAFGRAVYEGIRVPYVEFGGHSLERDYFEPSA